MPQARFTLTEVRQELERLREEVLNQTLDESAALYAELYESDPEGQAWVEDAAKRWPE